MPPRRPVPRGRSLPSGGAEEQQENAPKGFLQRWMWTTANDTIEDEGEATSTDENSGKADTSVADKLLASDPRFSVFLSRMRESRRSFNVKNKSTGKREYVTWDYFDDDDEAVEAAEDEKRERRFAGDVEADDDGEDGAAGSGLLSKEEQERVKAQNVVRREEYLAACAKTFIKRRRRFDGKTGGSFFNLLFRPLAIALIAILALFVMWYPLWDRILIDIEADDHYVTLEISQGATSKEIKKAYREMTKRWHPDQNPTCGQKCRDKMMRIQQAHDVLLARGSEETRTELLRQYEEALNHWISIVLFRGFDMARRTADYASFAVHWVFRIAGSTLVKFGINEERVNLWTRLTFLATFAALVVTHVTASPMILMEFFYFLVYAWKPNPATERENAIVKRSVFNIKGDTLLILLPALLSHVVYFNFLDPYPEWNLFWFRLVMGFSYVASHLVAFTPNLIDNIQMMKCSLPWPYLSQTGQSDSFKTYSGSFAVTPLWFIVAELGLVVNDVYAFALRIPAPYRVAVLATHCAFLVQMSALPWDTPVIGRLQRRAARESAAGSTEEERAASRRERKARAAAGNSEALVPATEAEEGLVSGLSRDRITFELVMSPKIRSLIVQENERHREIASAAKKTGTQADAPQFQVFFHSELSHVILTTVKPGAGGGRPDFNELGRAADPEGARALMCGGGMTFLWPDPTHTQRKLSQVTEKQMQEAREKAAAAVTRAFQNGECDPRCTLAQLQRDRLVDTALVKGMPALLRAVGQVWLAATAIIILAAAATLMVPPVLRDQPKYVPGRAPMVDVPIAGHKYTGLLPHDFPLLDAARGAGSLVLEAHPSSLFVDAPKSESKEDSKKRKLHRARFFDEEQRVSVPVLGPDMFDATRQVLGFQRYVLGKAQEAPQEERRQQRPPQRRGRKQ